MAYSLTIADFKERARRRVPKLFFEYADSGSYTEGTYRANEDDFHKIKLRQRVLVDMANRSLETEMIGQKVTMPVALAPTGLTGMQRADLEQERDAPLDVHGIELTFVEIDELAPRTRRSIQAHERTERFGQLRIESQRAFVVHGGAFAIGEPFENAGCA